jgi:hypothetical protein
MRITVNIEEELFDRAAKLTGIKEKTVLVARGLETLIAIKSGKKLYTDEPMGKVKVISDFLPPPGHVLLKKKRKVLR